ncbi:MAG: insulinase family protein [Candidatus Riflebacteria bacterium]|nr:insulinase family protein [Candidatus Riflebacteria bacterium]
MNIIKSKIVSVALLCAFSVISSSLFALVKSPPEKAILPNGLRVIAVEDKSLPVVAAGIVFDTRVFYRNNRNSGLGRVYRSLLDSSGLKNESRFDFNARLEQVGIITEFGGGQDMFYSACNGNAEHLNVILESLLNLGFNLKPTAEDFARAKSEAVRYSVSTKKYPRSTGFMERMIWKDIYPDGAAECNSPISEQMLEKIQFEDLDAFTSSVFVPNNAVLVVVGDISASDVFKTSMKLFGELQAVTVDASIDGDSVKPEPKKSGKIENIEYLDIEETEVLLGFEAPGYNDPEMSSAFLWQAALHDINNSWLEYTVKKDFPELKNLYARYIPGRDNGIFVIGFTTSEADANSSTNFILTALGNLYMAPPKGIELRRIVEMMQLKNLEKRESRLERVYDLGFSEIMGNFRTAEGIAAAYSRVVPDDMQKLARKMFSSDRYSVRIIYPLKYQKAEEIAVKMQVLPNGAKVIVRNFSGSEVVGLTVLFGMDACAGNDENKKLARLVAEMIAGYINDSDNRHLNNQLDEVGASVVAAFGGDSLVLSARTQKQRLPELLDFLKKLILKPDFSEEFFLRSKNKILQRIEEESSNADHIVFNQLLDGMYPGMNFYSADFLKNDLDKITYAQAGKFYREWAVASNMYISAVGNFDSNKALELISRAFADFPQGKIAEATHCPSWVGMPLDKTEVKEVKLPANAEYAHIAAGFRMKQFLKLESHDELRTTFGANSVLSHLLFVSSNALIAQELKKIDAYRGLRGGYNTNQLFSIFSFSAAVPVEKLDEAKRVIENVIKRIPELDISRDNIRSAGQKINSFFNRALEKSDAQSRVFATFLANGLKTDFLEEIIGIYGSVSIDDVKKAARENFNHYFMVIGRPEK